MKNLLKHFPKEIAFPRRVIVNNIDEFFKKFKEYNGSKNKLYFSLYNKVTTEQPYKYIDVIAFDLDNSNRLKNTIKIHKYLKSVNLKHCLIFSTAGFWVYILTKNYENLNFPRQSLINSHDYFGEVFGLKWGNAHDSDLDKTIRGDTVRIARLVGGCDIKRKLNCISLTGKDLELGMKHIKDKSKSSKFKLKIIWYGKELFDISKMDSQITNTKDYTPKNMKHNFNVPKTSFDEIKRINDKLVNEFMPIIAYWLKTPEVCVYNVRQYITNYFINIQLPDYIIDKIMFKYLSLQPRTDSYKNNYNHWKRNNSIIKAKQVEKNSKNGEICLKYSFPRIETLFEQGYIKSASYLDYVKYNEIYYNSYDLKKVKKYFENRN